MNSYISIDIGASGGRLMLGTIQNNKLLLKEVYRFYNGIIQNNDSSFWDIDNIIKEILIGLQKVKKQGVTNCTIGVDTWAIDYVLLDKNGDKLKNPIPYRDKRTTGIHKKVEKLIPKKDHYLKTGIQFLNFNTIYQLYTEPKEIIEKTKYIMLIPDYINYMLTGKIVTEYTNASTTAMLDYKTKRYCPDLLSIAGVKPQQFPNFVDIGTYLGPIIEKWHTLYDLPLCEVYLTPTHDTASAVLAAPSPSTNISWAFISSGTWSLIGMENKKAIISEEAYISNYSNEGGAYGTYRFLNNIMGLWLIQEVRRNYNKNNNDISFETLAVLAQKEKPYALLINPNHGDFLSPSNMIEAIQNHIQKSGQSTLPLTIGQLARCIFDSLAVSYKIALNNLEKITGKAVDNLFIIGGGCQNNLLNQLTSDMIGKKVTAGPIEATSIGNIISQLIATNIVNDINEGRALIRNSFPLTIFKPIQGFEPEKILKRYKEVVYDK